GGDSPAVGCQGHQRGGPGRGPVRGEDLDSAGRHWCGQGHSGKKAEQEGRPGEQSHGWTFDEPGGKFTVLALQISSHTPLDELPLTGEPRSCYAVRSKNRPNRLASALARSSRLNKTLEGPTD